jgi:hypothetical protein
MPRSRILFGLFLITSSLSALAQSSPAVLTLPSRPAHAPERYVVAQVLDERPEPGALGNQFGETPPNVPAHATPLVLSGEALSRFLKAANRRSDASLYPVVIRVKKLRFSEKLATPRQAEGQLAATLAFEVLRNGTRTPLTEFEGGGRYSRPLSLPATELNASLLQQTLENALRYLDQWLLRNAAGQESLAKRVRITFRPDPALTDVGDTVFYNPRRPLRWDDFRAAPRSGKNYGAAVFSSFGYEATSRTVGGVVEVAMTVKVYELKNSSWAWESAKNDYALRHEQLHFDITRLVAGRFRQRLLAEDLAPDEYDARIQYLFLDAFREMNRLQEQYDAETAHSVNRAAQARWDAKITEELTPLLAQNP